MDNTNNTTAKNLYLEKNLSIFSDNSAKLGDNYHKTITIWVVNLSPFKNQFKKY